MVVAPADVADETEGAEEVVVRAACVEWALEDVVADVADEVGSDGCLGLEELDGVPHVEERRRRRYC